MPNHHQGDSLPIYRRIRMNNKIRFRYYYGKEADQYSFLRVPKLLFSDKLFRKLSTDAKLLYSLMLDRMSLSIKNGWKDELDRTYIIYTIDQMAEDLGCSRDKAIKAAAELDSKKGIGLIERIRHGQGRPDTIYVMNFVVNEDTDNTKDTATLPSYDDGSISAPEVDVETSPVTSIFAEVEESDFKKSEISTSRNQKNRLLEVGISDSNKTEYNKTDVNDTYPINLSSQKEVYNEQQYLEYYEQYKNYFKSIIDYEALCQSYNSADIRLVDTIIELMTEVATSSKETFVISGSTIPKAMVMSRFEQYDMNTIQYVVSCMNENSSDVRNIKSYLLATLYNAPLMMNAYYQQQVNYDLYGGGMVNHATNGTGY